MSTAIQAAAEEDGPEAKTEQKQGATGGRSAASKRDNAKTTKTDAVLALLTRPKGASLDDIMKATGWQAHSVRGFIAGTLKKKRGMTVASDASEKGRIYRIEGSTAP